MTIVVTPEDLRPKPYRPESEKAGVPKETEKEFKKREKELQPTIKKLERAEEEALALQRAERIGTPYINLMGFPINTDALSVIREEDARAAKAVIFWRQGKDVRLGAIDPSSRAVKDIENELVDREGLHIRRFLISPRSLELAFALYSKVPSGEERRDRFMELPTEELDIFEREIKSIRELGKRIAELPTTEVLNTIIAGAVKTHSSDMHVEPKEGYARLRYRIDGVLQDITNFSLDGYQKLLSRVKVLAGLKLNIHELPQDGSFVLQTSGSVIDIRVSILPGGFGENIVLRLLDRNMSVVSIEELGMKKRDIDLIREELKKPDGMILATGPTGSGKTTTLAAFIQHVNSPELKIITLEDPIEYRIPGVEQTQVDESAGYTFSRGLRSILRQDPDVLLIGEIRDTDTAETAMHAALTGHLVFSTLHTNDAAGAVPRLIDMGVRPFILAPSINAVIAQRLVRKVCPKCGTDYTPDGKEREELRAVMRGVIKDVFDPARLAAADLTLKKAAGCDACNTSGYHGRVAVFEIFSMRDELEQLTIEGADTKQIKEAALRQGMTTITQDAVLKLLDGITTLDEVRRVGEV
jgi:type II secretory ATPase GspE/PulE/Tfp pilus assembly ATPase PilB-like protein